MRKVRKAAGLVRPKTAELPKKEVTVKIHQCLTRYTLPVMFLSGSTAKARAGAPVPSFIQSNFYYDDTADKRNEIR